MIITFNGVASTTAALGIASVIRVERPVVSGTRDRLLGVPSRRGAYHFTADYTEAYIPVRLYFAAASATAKRACLRAIAAWLDTGGELATLVIDDESTKQYYARVVESVTPLEIVDRGWLDLTFIVPDGIAHSTVTKTASPNAGTLPAPVEVTATMTADAPGGMTIELVATGEKVILDTALVSGNEVVVDTALRYVTLNGADAMEYVDFSSEFFEVPVGEFEITSTDSTNTIVYRERWVG